jgi:hypothetical protein
VNAATTRTVAATKASDGQGGGRVALSLSPPVIAV